MTGYNNSTNPLPDALRGHSPGNVNTLLHIGWSEEMTKILLDYADANNDHPDWSEASYEEIEEHFAILEAMIMMERK